MVALLRRFGLWIAIGAFAVVGYFFRDFLSGNVGDLKVGDCFDVPGNATVGSTVKDVQHHPCTDVHGAEVVFIGSVTGANDSYPGDDAFKSFAKAQCVPAYATYTGRDFDADSTYDMSYMSPTTSGWAKGDHAVVCYAIRIDSAPIKGTVKATP